MPDTGPQLGWTSSHQMLSGRLGCPLFHARNASASPVHVLPTLALLVLHILQPLVLFLHDRLGDIMELWRSPK